MFRGSGKIGTENAMIIKILGGADDAGAVVIWAPEVIQNAYVHGPVLAEIGKFWDTKAGQTLSDGVPPMPLRTSVELVDWPRTHVLEIVRFGVRRYWDMVALSGYGIRGARHHAR